MTTVLSAKNGERDAAPPPAWASDSWAFSARWQIAPFKMLLRLIFAGAAAAGAAAADLDLVLLDRATYPLATCNDGSMAGYYLRKGSETDFLVFQQGG